MERLILVLSAFVIVALGGVRAEECSHASFTVQYEKCHMNYTEAIYTKVSPRDVSHCMGVSNDLINCLKTLLDRCKDNSDLKWFQLSYSSGHIQKAAKYVCNHMDEIKALVNCAINPGGYAKCVGDATQGSADFCTRLNALLACTTQFYEKCTATQREVAKNLFFMSHPGDCSKSQECDETNVRFRYNACMTDVKAFLLTQNTSVSRCTQLYDHAADCYDDLRGHCGNSDATKWLEYAMTGSSLRRAGNYTCSHLRTFHELKKCEKDVTQFAMCTLQAARALHTTDFCARWNAIGPCYRLFYENCSPEQRKVAEEAFEMQRPDGCESHGTKTGVGLASLALPSILIVLYGLMA